MRGNIWLPTNLRSNLPPPYLLIYGHVLNKLKVYQESEQHSLFPIIQIPPKGNIPPIGPTFYYNDIKVATKGDQTRKSLHKGLLSYPDILPE
ncbi:hypothetical protein H5410_023249 [Solanum commersonii]|uniref:Uncharacterized protein n=1 Tax=Solanum commersonii TaxID=4109 RepID=A0A9J5ZJ06_SOLCO|nr:hypothetical protein H5410_023249 [Solanum commersonii]